MNTAQSNSQKENYIVVAIVLSSMFLFTFTQFLLITAYPTIMEDFGINATQVQWLTTAFLLTTVIFIPMTGYLSDTFSTRTLVIFSLITLVAGTIIGIIAPNFVVLVFARVVQAIGAGIMMPLVQTILLAVFPLNKRGFAMGLLGLVVNVAPASAPSLSGIIIDAFSWHALFWVMLPLALIALFAAWFFMKNVTSQRPSQLDVLSIALSGLGFAGVIFGFSRASVVGIGHWSVIGSVAAGLILLVIFVWRQLKVKVPTLNLRVFRTPVFAISTVLVFLVAMLLLSAETILPMFGQIVLGTSAFTSGAVLIPGTVLLSVMSLVGGGLFDKYGGKVITIIGFASILVSTILFSTMGMNTEPYMIIIYFCVFMFGFGLTLMPLVTLGMNALNDEEIAHGSAIVNTVRQFGLAFGVIVLTSIISFRVSGSDLSQSEATLAGGTDAFIVMSALAFVGLVISLFIKEGERDRQ
ncbi:DHA2 family efflux MFS transporter permease subunit [Lentibacillus sediminis]|uniref:DHA2 family efflux MFS transporter permease subunit n=1 Tax=Lentibacillus sediminis TaxID=1940529 RepID=UPI000C1B8AC8|nr:DHA2 family efflux MFS transporter permease subunit [Lentibacillus sediminis]